MDNSRWICYNLSAVGLAFIGRFWGGPFALRWCLLEGVLWRLLGLSVPFFLSRLRGYERFLWLYSRRVCIALTSLLFWRFLGMRFEVRLSWFVVAVYVRRVRDRNVSGPGFWQGIPRACVDANEIVKSLLSCGCVPSSPFDDCRLRFAIHCFDLFEFWRLLSWRFDRPRLELRIRRLTGWRLCMSGKESLFGSPTYFQIEILECYFFGS